MGSTAAIFGVLSSTYLCLMTVFVAELSLYRISMGTFKLNLKPDMDCKFEKWGFSSEQ